MKGSDDDHKTLEPHADVDDNGHHKRESNTASQLFDPEKLGRNHVTRHHDPVRPPIWAKSPVVKCVLLVVITGVPCRKEFCEVSNAHNRAR